MLRLFLPSLLRSFCMFLLSSYTLHLVPSSSLASSSTFYSHLYAMRRDRAKGSADREYSRHWEYVVRFYLYMTKWISFYGIALSLALPRSNAKVQQFHSTSIHCIILLFRSTMPSTCMWYISGWFFSRANCAVYFIVEKSNSTRLLLRRTFVSHLESHPFFPF